LGLLIGIAVGAAACFFLGYSNWVLKTPTGSDMKPRDGKARQPAVDPHVLETDSANERFAQFVELNPDLKEWKVQDPAISDPGFVHLGEFKHLKTLSLRACTFLTDKGTVGLKNLNELENLSLVDDTNVGNLTLPYIVKLPLKRLELRRTKIDDRGAPLIASIKTLRELDLTGSFITNKGIKILAEGLPNLNELDLSNMPKLTDKGVALLAPMKSLRHLSLDVNTGLGAGFPKLAPLDLTFLDLKETAVRDSDLPYFLGMKHLETLRLQKTPISDDGLKTIAKMKALRHLDLVETPDISDAAVEKLHTERPDIVIFRQIAPGKDWVHDVLPFAKDEMENNGP
jgi:hypothetical protein